MNRIDYIYAISDLQNGKQQSNMYCTVTEQTSQVGYFIVRCSNFGLKEVSGYARSQSIFKKVKILIPEYAFRQYTTHKIVTHHTNRITSILS